MEFGRYSNWRVLTNCEDRTRFLSSMLNLREKEADMMKVVKRVVCFMIALVVMVCATSVASDAAKKFRTYSNSRFSYKVSVPVDFTSQVPYSNDEGAIFKTADGKIKATIYASYISNKKSGKAIVATAKKSRKITVVRQGKKDCAYYYKSGNNVVYCGVCIVKKGCITCQVCYPKTVKGYNKIADKIVKSMKKNKKLVLKS